MSSDNPRMLVNDCIYGGSCDELRELLTTYPQVVNSVEEKSGFPTPIHVAASQDKLDMVQLLIERGADPNVPGPGNSTPLTLAASAGNVALVALLLRNRANPTIGRPLIGAIRNPEDIGLEIVKLLVDHGALLNECYFPFDDTTQPQINPLAWAMWHDKHQIADYLRSKGAVLPPEKSASGSTNTADCIRSHFASKLGPPQPLSQQEIVPTGMPITIHVIPPSEGRNHLTLFTIGMSDRPMQTPKGGERLQYAELAFNLPASWPLPSGTKRSLFSWLPRGKAFASVPPGGALWPFEWLRSIARYPHENQMVLGGAGVIIANDDPPKPLAPGVAFTSVLLINTEEISCSNGVNVQIFQMLPIYTEERNLEIAEGLPALLNALDRSNISWVFDPNRKNVGN
jgi:hypothetical protein